MTTYDAKAYETEGNVLATPIIVTPDGVGYPLAPSTEWLPPESEPEVGADDPFLRILRRMEWQKAVGHLFAMQETYSDPEDEEYLDVEGKIRRFIEWMEEEL